MFCLICVQFQTVSVLVVRFALAVHTHVQAWICFLIICGLSCASNAFVHIGGEGFNCCRLGSDGICKLLHYRLDIIQFIVVTCSHRACRIVVSVSEDSLAIHAGFKLYDALGLCNVLLFQCHRVLHCCCEYAVCCCVDCPSLGDLEGVGVGILAEDSADLIALLILIAL